MRSLTRRLREPKFKHAKPRNIASAKALHGFYYAQQKPKRPATKALKALRCPEPILQGSGEANCKTKQHMVPFLNLVGPDIHAVHSDSIYAGTHAEQATNKRSVRRELQRLSLRRSAQVARSFTHIGKVDDSHNALRNKSRVASLRTYCSWRGSLVRENSCSTSVSTVPSGATTNSVPKRKIPIRTRPQCSHVATLIRPEAAG